MNWLQCSRCQTLYVQFFEKIALKEFLAYTLCKLCDKNYSRGAKNIEVANKLASNLIMPTFVKDVSNVQFKMIWQNAGIELAEANKIVFMGYSFPDAILN